ncbi:MAG: site-specific DNA-methyltransferase [Bryobacteraceae bacterium]
MLYQGAPGDGKKAVAQVTAQIWNEDTIPGMAGRLEPESVDLTVTSVPFGALFMYSGKNEDIGNNPDGVDMRASQFGLHMRFFIEQLLRVMKPGRNVCIHIQQLLRYKNQHGYMGRRDFRGAVVDLFEAGGFEWIGEVSIPKNPQIIAKRLNLHCLMFETGRTNGTKLAPAVNDYVMIFQKPGDSAVRVRCLYDSEKNPGGWVSQEEWIAWARGVWNDIRETDVLDGWKSARESGEEKHVCPLQLEVIRRCIRLYTNPGELVCDPFMGIGSTAVVAIELGRDSVGFELKESYFAQAQRNAAKYLDAPQEQPELDLLSTCELSPSQLTG